MKYAQVYIGFSVPSMIAVRESEKELSRLENHELFDIFNFYIWDEARYLKDEHFMAHPRSRRLMKVAEEAFMYSKTTEQELINYILNNTNITQIYKAELQFDDNKKISRNYVFFTDEGVEWFKSITSFKAHRVLTRDIANTKTLMKDFVSDKDVCGNESELMNGYDYINKHFSLVAAVK